MYANNVNSFEQQPAPGLQHQAYPGFDHQLPPPPEHHHTSFEQQQQQQQQQYPVFEQHPGFEQQIYPSFEQQQPPQLAPIASDGLTRKRTREEVENGDDPAKRLAPTPEVLFRLLVPPNLIGKVIGKQGLRIKQIREETGAHIKIADPLSVSLMHQCVEERVVLISSKDEPGLPQCAAEQGLIRVATLVIEPEIGDNVVTATIGPQHYGGSNLTRILIAGSQAGSVIGKGGSVVREIRETSGANVRILPPEQLPICASACETDRLVQISGEIPQVQKALELIAAKLRENPPREVVTAHPSFYFAANASQPQMLLAQAGIPGYTFAPSDADPSSMAAYATMMSQADMMGGYATSIPIIPKVMAEMKVPSALIGGVIGRGGANITQIRNLSGASIKVTGQKDGGPERIIYIEGSSEQVLTAQSLVQAFMFPQQQTGTYVQ